MSDDFATMGDFYYMPIAAHNPIAYFAIALYYAFLNGMLLAGLSMWISGFIQSRYAVYTVPAIAVFLQIQIARILKLPFEWRLDMWLSMRGIIREEQTTIWAAFVVVVSILAVCAWSFLKKGKKVIDYA
jgi:hypothetical protein